MKLVTPYVNIKQYEQRTDVFSGLNTTDRAKDGEFVKMKNISNRLYPSICPREPKSIYSSDFTASKLFSYNNDLYVVSSGSLYKNDELITDDLDVSDKSIVEFNKYILVFPDMFYYDTVNDETGFFLNGTEVTEPNPEILHACVYNNRVFGVNGNNIYASKQGDFREWNVFNQLNTDSWATDVAGAVVFRAISAYQNHVVIHSQSNMYELYGYKPENFQIQDVGYFGSETDHVEVAGAMYFANHNGLYRYAGGAPRLVSENIETEFEFPVIGADERYVYIAISHFISSELLVYDTKLGIFSSYDNLATAQFVDILHHKIYIASGRSTVDGSLIDSKLLYSDMFGNIYELRSDSDGEKVEWELETINFKDDMFKNKKVTQFVVNCEMSLGSSINIYVKYNETNGWELLRRFKSETNKNLIIPAFLKSSTYSIKITGIGHVKINGFLRKYTDGGRI